MVNFATNAEIAPSAAKTGAKTAPTAATVTGISTNVLPCSSRTMIRRVAFVDQGLDLIHEIPSEHLHFLYKVL